MVTGQYYLALVGAIPFLVLGVGIDDMFIMIDGKFDPYSFVKVYLNV